MKKEKNFIHTFMIAVSNCSLYSREHEAFDDLATRAMSALSDAMEERLEIMIVDNELVINKTPYRDSGIHGTNLIKRLKKKGTSCIELFQDITLSEMKRFIADFSETGKELKTYPHIRIGSVGLHLAIPGSQDRTGDLSLLSADDSAKIQDVFYSASQSKTLKVTALEEVVLNFIVSFREKAGVLSYLSPVKSHNEYTYTHATNVAILSLFQAESLGIKNELLHDIGMAALLHDSGKLYMPSKILDKKGKLDDHEFNEIKKHPLYGAVYLARIDNLTRLAPLAAFEHHMKYDGSGYPKPYSNGKKQHICSQIIAISDFFDALRSRRPYRESMRTEDIVVMMKEGINKDFNPLLVDNFIRLLEHSADITPQSSN